MVEAGAMTGGGPARDEQGSLHEWIGAAISCLVGGDAWRDFGGHLGPALYLSGSNLLTPTRPRRTKPPFFHRLVTTSVGRLSSGRTADHSRLHASSARMPRRRQRWIAMRRGRLTGISAGSEPSAMMSLPTSLVAGSSSDTSTCPSTRTRWPGFSFAGRAKIGGEIVPGNQARPFCHLVHAPCRAQKPVLARAA